MDKSICSSLLLAEVCKMPSIVSNQGTFILKPGSKISVATKDIVVNAVMDRGFHRLTTDQMEKIAKVAQNK